MYKVTGGDGREYGPITAEQVRQWIAEGRLSASSRVQADGGEWKTLAQFPEFATLPGSTLPRPGGMPTSAAYSGTPSRTSAMAIISLVLGILGLFTCGLSGIVGLILGIVAYTKIKKSNGQLEGSGLAIAGMCTSGAFLLMLPVFAGLLLPALAKAKERAQSIQCMNHAKQLGLAVRMYSDSHGDQLPPVATWCDAISSQADPENFLCPTRPGQRSSFAMNQALGGRREPQVNPRTVLLFESDAGWNSAGGARIAASHGHTASGRNREHTVVVVFVDGSAQLVPESQLASLRWQP